MANLSGILEKILEGGRRARSLLDPEELADFNRHYGTRLTRKDVEQMLKERGEVVQPPQGKAKASLLPDQLKNRTKSELEGLLANPKRLDMMNTLRRNQDPSAVPITKDQVQEALLTATEPPKFKAPQEAPAITEGGFDATSAKGIKATYNVPEDGHLVKKYQELRDGLPEPPVKPSKKKQPKQDGLLRSAIEAQQQGVDLVPERKSLLDRAVGLTEQLDEAEAARIGSLKATKEKPAEPVVPEPTQGLLKPRPPIEPEPVTALVPYQGVQKQATPEFRPEDFGVEKPEIPWLPKTPEPAAPVTPMRAPEFRPDALKEDIPWLPKEPPKAPVAVAEQPQVIPPFIRETPPIMEEVVPPLKPLQAKAPEATASQPGGPSALRSGLLAGGTIAGSMMLPSSTPSEEKVIPGIGGPVEAVPAQKPLLTPPSVEEVRDQEAGRRKVGLGLPAEVKKAPQEIPAELGFPAETVKGFNALPDLPPEVKDPIVSKLTELTQRAKSVEESLQKRIDEAKSTYEAQQNKAALAEFAGNAIQHLARIGAAIHGLSTGQSIAGQMKTEPISLQKHMDRLFSEYQNEVDRADKQAAGQMKAIEGEKELTMRADEAIKKREFEVSQKQAEQEFKNAQMKAEQEFEREKLRIQRDNKLTELGKSSQLRIAEDKLQREFQAAQNDLNRKTQVQTAGIRAAGDAASRPLTTVQLYNMQSQYDKNVGELRGALAALPQAKEKDRPKLLQDAVSLANQLKVPQAEIDQLVKSGGKDPNFISKLFGAVPPPESVTIPPFQPPQPNSPPTPAPASTQPAANEKWVRETDTNGVQWDVKYVGGKPVGKKATK